MKVRVRIYGDLAATFGNNHYFELEKDKTVRDLTNTLAKKAGQKRRGYLGEFKIGPDLAIIINGKNIALLEGLKTILKDEDDIVIMPFVVGG
jgi:MoaD family protein